jgi:hypothetical protein
MTDIASNTMPSDNEIVEAMARAVWLRHYPASPGSLAEKVVVPWENASPASRREYILDAQAALAAQRAMGMVLVPVEPSQEAVDAIGEAVDEYKSCAYIYRAMIAAAQAPQ